jgi:hypothetical protein
MIMVMVAMRPVNMIFLMRVLTMLARRALVVLVVMSMVVLMPMIMLVIMIMVVLMPIVMLLVMIMVMLCMIVAMCIFIVGMVVKVLGSLLFRFICSCNVPTMLPLSVEVGKQFLCSWAKEPVQIDLKTLDFNPHTQYQALT